MRGNLWVLAHTYLLAVGHSVLVALSLHFLEVGFRIDLESVSCWLFLAIGSNLNLLLGLNKWVDSLGPQLGLLGDGLATGRAIHATLTEAGWSTTRSPRRLDSFLLGGGAS